MAFNTLAQEPRSYSFTHYTTTSGLLSNQVNTIVQDEAGYIWTGTTDGLQRFDGTRYKTFTHKEYDSSSIPSNPVWQLLIDKKKNLWLLMSDGSVGIFDTRSFTFRKIPAHFKKPVTPNTSLKRLSVDESGHVFYLLSGSEIITFNEKAAAFSYQYNFLKLGENWDVVDCIQEPGTPHYWMSVKDIGMAMYNARTQVLSYPGNNIEKKPLIEQYTRTNVYDHLFIDRQHRLWSVNWTVLPNIQCYDLSANSQVLVNATLEPQLKTYHEIKGFIQQRDGSIWVNGLLVFARYLEAARQFQPVVNGYINEQSISYEQVHCLFEDREKNIWVATDNNGLYRFNPATEFFRNIKHTNRSNLLPGKGGVMSFLPTRRGTVLAGTWGDGLYEYDKDFNAIPIGIKGLGSATTPFAWCMAASADSNHIWMSAQPGVYVIDQSKQSFNFYNPLILKNGTVRQIAEDKNGNLWLGMAGTGVYKWTSANCIKKFEDGLSAITAIPAVQINKITVDSKGLVWVGTPENGVYVIESGSDKLNMRFTDSPGNGKQLPERGISSILEYSDSVMIITTATRVVSYNRQANSIRIIGSPGMISGFITAVEKDKAGYLWLTSTNGLYRINIQKTSFLRFTRTEGINNEHFVQSASRVLPDGRMMFGSTDDILIFDPGKIITNPATPVVQITGFKVMGKPVQLDSLLQSGGVELGYQDNSLSIEFSPLVYNSPCLIKYELEKLDKTWKTADRNNEAVYSYLPAGEYTFLVKAVDEDGRESAQATRLHIIVHPPFWKTWWFYSLLVLVSGMVLFWLDRERMKRKAAIQKMRSEIADNLYQDVQTALGNITILSEIAKLKADQEPEKSKDYIQQIHSKSQQMMVVIDDMLWGMHPENDSMHKTIERVKEDIDNLRNSKNVQINLLVDEKVEQLNLNMKMRQHVFWFFKTGINNIVKTGATVCNIHIALEKAHLLYIIEFDNTQADMQQLRNMLQRQELEKKLAEVNGTISLREQQTMTMIKLSIPV